MRADAIVAALPAAFSPLAFNGDPIAFDEGELKNTKASRLVDRLRQCILAGALAPGSKINLEKLRREFDVSLSPLREALARLIAVGLVELHDNRGYRVAPVSPENLLEITRLRGEFEGLALSMAIRQGGLQWEGAVMRALHRLNRTTRDPADPGTLEPWEALHGEFHSALLAGCEMPLLLSFCQILHDLHDRYRRVLALEHAGDRDIAAEHSDIAQGAVARDAAYACAKLRDHIQRTGDALRARLAHDFVS